ncbi:MAG: DUF4249 domain-containing protein [Bacteroidales bacterium]|nr:DUF4249 domain-containing protein [Bacteroidales bacterium]
MKKILFWGCLLLATACTNELDFDLESAPDALLLSAQLRAEDTRHAVYASLGTGGTLAKAPDLEIWCYVNDKPVTQAVPDKLETVIPPVKPERTAYQRTIYVLDATFEPGDRVRITAEAPGWQASGQSVFPRRPKVTAVDTLSILTPNRWRPEEVTRDLQVSVSLDDPAGEDNWYMLETLLRREVVLHGPTEPDSLMQDIRYIRPNTGDDPILSDGVIISNEELFGTISVNSYNYFSDRLFAGETGRMTFKIGHSDLGASYAPSLNYDQMMRFTSADVTTILEVRVLSIGQEEYNYMKAIGIQASGFYFSNFMEPVAIPNNVSGATGFIGTLSGQSSRFVFPDMHLNWGGIMTESK